MYTSVFREWKVAAVFVAGICLFVGAYFAEGGGYESLEFRRKEKPKVAAAPIVAAAPARPAAPGAADFTSDEELAAAYTDPSEAAATASAAADPNQPPADGIAPPPADGEAASAPAPAQVPSAVAQQVP